MGNTQSGKTGEATTGTGLFILKPGLGRTLLFWFLALSLLPLTAVSLFSYSNARTSLSESAGMHLTAVTAIKAEHIRSYFERMLTDLRQESEETGNARFLLELQSAFEESGKPLGEFVKGF